MTSAPGSPARDESSRLDLLDAARVLAVLGVLAFHYLFNGIVNGKISSLHVLGPSAAIAQYGYLGVELFFMISGYVIFFSAQGSTAQRFAVARVLRLYPAFWFAVLFTAGVAVFLGGERMSVGPLQVLANLTMLAPLFRQGYVDGVYWTLVCELTFYAAVFVVLVAGQARRLEAIFIAWPVVILLATLAHLGGWPLLGGYYAYFAAGALFAVLRRGPSRPAAAALALSFALCLQCSLGSLPAKEAMTGAPFSAVVVGAVIVSFYLLFALVNSARGTALRLPFARLGGALTYPVYLVHAHVGYMLLSRFATPQNLWAAYAGTLAVVLAVALFIHFVIERRLRPQWRALFSSTVGRLAGAAPTLAGGGTHAPR